MSRNKPAISIRGAADSSKPDSRFTAYLINHAQVFFSSLGKLYRKPLANLMTVAVIAIALAFPMGLSLLLQNLQAVSGGWNGSTQISLFIKQTISDEKAAELGQTLRQSPEIESLTVLTSAEAMSEFKAMSGFAEALDVLEKNPLPAVLIVRPDSNNSSPAQIATLLEKLRTLPEVAIALLDMQWVEKLHTMLAIAKRGILIISVLLGLAVLLTVGNTIRLDIQSRRDEIVVVKLMGATDAFIRRPFLYTGFWYGLMGGILSTLMIATSFSLLSAPVQKLAGLYDSQFHLTTLSAGTAFALMTGSILLSLMGSWLAVGRHLSEIEPS